MGEAGAAELYRAFLDDVCGTVRGLEGVEREMWVPRRPGAADYFRERHPDFRLRWQEGADLGARLRGAFGAAFDEGAGRVLAVGSDHPTLPAGHLRAAFSGGPEPEVRLGPTPDGGYWGIGLTRAAWPRAAGLFADLPWSSSDLLAATRRRAGALGLPVRELPSWYDVDEPSGLDRLREDVLRGSATARALERFEGGAGGARTGEDERGRPRRDEVG